MILSAVKTILSPYFNHVKVDFRPLEYIEIEQNKPLIIKLSEKWQFKTYLQRADNFIKFNSNKNAIISSMAKLNQGEGLQFDGAKIVYYKLLIRLLFEISKNNYKGFFKKRSYFKYLHKSFMADVGLLTDVFKKVLEYNSRLKKKLQMLADFRIFQNETSEATSGGQRLSDLIKTDPVTGEKSFIH